MISVKRIQTFLTLLFLVLVFSFPRTIQMPKTIVLAALLLSAVFFLNLYVAYLKFFLAYFLIFLSPLIIAVLAGNETSYVINAFIIYFGFPFILTIIFQSFNREELLSLIYKSAVISIIIITITSLSTFLNAVGLFPLNLNAIFYPDEDRIGFNEGFIHIINSPLSYYLFLVPIVFSRAHEWNFKNWKPYFFFFLLLFSIGTGRRILLLPFIVVILLNLKYYFKYLLIVLVVAAAALYLTTNQHFENFEIGKVVDRFKDALTSTGDSEVRSEQIVYFKKYIEKSPVFGYGLGAYMHDYLRNNEFKTAYEDSFYYLIFCLGIPLSLLLLSIYMYLLYRNWNLDSSTSINSGICLGVLTLLLASFTNPYWMSSFDYSIPFGILITLAFKNKSWKRSLEY